MMSDVQRPRTLTNLDQIKSNGRFTQRSICLFCFFLNCKLFEAVKVEVFFDSSFFFQQEPLS